MRLTRLERNVIYEAIVQTNLDPAEFNLEIAGDTAVISHVSGSAFAFEYIDRGTEVHPPHYTVLTAVIDGRTRTFACNTPISNLVQSIQTWAKEAKLVAEAPDYWAEMQRNRELFANIQREDIENAPFTQDEQKQIAAQLQEIKKQVREQFDLTSEQIAHIDERLDESSRSHRTHGPERLASPVWRDNL